MDYLNDSAGSGQDAALSPGEPGTNLDQNAGRSRDRHGRGVRRPLWSPRFAPGIARKRGFADLVEDTANYLRSNFPTDFANLVVVVRDLPPMFATEDSQLTRRFAVQRESNTVYVYRIPIKYFGRAWDPIEEAMRVESYVIEGAAELVGKDPRDFFGPEN